jgi:hypothetical protein
MIGDRFFMSTAMVKMRVRHIFDKLEVHSRSQALAEASIRKAVLEATTFQRPRQRRYILADLMARI